MTERKPKTAPFTVSLNARHPYDLADGRSVSAGDRVEVVPEENASLIQDGILIPVREEQPEKKEPTTKKEDDK